MREMWCHVCGSPHPNHNAGCARLGEHNEARKVSYDRVAIIKAFERELDYILEDLPEHPDAIIAAAQNAVRAAGRKQ